MGGRRSEPGCGGGDSDSHRGDRDSGWQAMGGLWPAGGGRGLQLPLPLLLTSLWAVAVALELAYVLVHGPGLPAAGPLARTLHMLLAAFQLLNLLGNAVLFLSRNPGIGGVLLAGRAVGHGWEGGNRGMEMDSPVLKHHAGVKARSSVEVGKACRKRTQENQAIHRLACGAGLWFQGETSREGGSHGEASL